MAATATSFGVGSWGISNVETGIIIESISQDYTNSNKSIKDRTGNTTGISYYDEQVKVSLNGRIPTTAAFSGTLAASLSLGNALSAYLKGGVTGGLTIVEGITIDLNNEDYRSIKVTATFYPNITA